MAHLSARFVILFTLTLLIMGMFVVPATAEPAMECEPSVRNAFGWQAGVMYKCECVSDTGPCTWVEVTFGRKATTFSGTIKCNVTAANIGKNGTTIVASAIASGGNKTGSVCTQAYNALRARMILQRFNGTSYVTCVDTGYIYGSTDGGLVVNRVYGSAPCGSGSYRVYGGAWVLSGGVYYGGYVTSAAIAA